MKTPIHPQTVFTKFTTLVLAGISLFAMAHPIKAATLLSESFDYTLGQSLVGQNGGTGWGGAWAGVSEGTASAVIVDGLTFSDYATSGNAVRFDLTRTTANTSITLGRSIGTGIGSETTLYSSFLFSMNTTLNVETGTRVQTTSATNTNPTTSYYRNLSRRNNSNRLGISAGTDAPEVTGQFPSVFDGTTWLFVSRLSHVGVGPEQNAKMWLLDAADWDAFKNTSMTEADLDANSFVTINRTTTSSVGFSTSEFIQFATGLNANDTSFSVTYDELRYGTTLTSVIPEPSTYALLGLGLGALIWLRRRSAKA